MKNPKTAPIRWRALAPGDFDAIDRIAQAIHVDLFERTEVLFDKAARFPDGCKALLLGDRMVGYAIAHPWILGDAPAIDAFLPPLDRAPDCLFMHDVAILPEARGQGAAAGFVAMLKELTPRLGVDRLACVSVYGTDRMWARLGFQTVGGVDLAKYGPTARYMVAPVAPAAT